MCCTFQKICFKRRTTSILKRIFNGKVDRVRAAMSRRGLSAVAAVARSTYGGEQLRYTNADFFTDEALWTISEIGLAARGIWVRLGQSRRSPLGLKTY